MAAAAGAGPRRSPWPLLVAVGFAASELGILVGSLPVAVGGLVAFGGAGAGLVHGAGHARSPARPMQLVGAAFAVGGAAVVFALGTPPTVAGLLGASGAGGLVARGLSFLLAGGLLLGLGTAGGRRFGDAG